MLTALLNYGAAMLGGTLFLAALGLPLQHWSARCWATAAAMDWAASPPCGFRRACAHRRSGRGATALFARWGLLGIFLTRFVLTPVALPVNLLAGSTRYPWPRYLKAVIAGEATWVGLFGGAGYAFAQQWESISSLVSDGGGVLLGAVLVAMAGRWLWRHRLRPRP